MVDENIPQKTFGLIEKLCNESLTSEDHAELEAILAQNAKARRLYLRYIELHTNLKRIHLRTAVPAPSGVSLMHAVMSELRGTTLSNERNPASHSRTQWRRLLGVVCSLIVVSAGLWWNQPKPENIIGNRTEPPDSQSVAVLQDSQEIFLHQEAGAIFYREETPRAGSRLKTHHQYSLLEGQIEIAFPRGARVILDSPAFFELLSEDQVALSYGNCSVHAPAGAEGFEVFTPATQVIDRGTRFSVKVDESGLSEVHVIEGLVETFQGEFDRTELSEGEAKRYRVDEQSAEDVPFASKSYRRQLPDRLMSFDGETNNRGEISTLSRLTVSRGGQPCEYEFEELIGCDVVSFCERGSPPTANFVFPKNYEGTLEELSLHDNSFLTGILNPGGTKKPHIGPIVLPGPGVSKADLTPGMTLRFHEPLVNQAGPDLVIFDEQTAVHPLSGDAFHLRPFEMTSGMKPMTVRKYDIGMLSPESRPMVVFDLLRSDETIMTLDDLFRIKLRNSTVSLDYRVVGTAVDLSDMGIPLNGQIQELFLQDVHDDEFRIDPVLIAGFPPIKEPNRKKPR